MIRRSDRPLLDRIFAKVRQDPSGCWFWTGWRNHDGYGRIRLDGRMVFVHRLVYELSTGPVPEGKEVCHTCDVRHCIRPLHLVAATHEENIRDAKLKGRMRGRGGRTHCLRGHAFTDENTIHRKDGTRTCRTCRQASSQRRAA